MLSDYLVVALEPKLERGYATISSLTHRPMDKS